jgi:hypothetical protein
MNPDTRQSRSLQDSDRVTRRFSFLWRRTIVSDVVQGIIAGGVLAFFTAILVMTAEDRAINTRFNGWSTTLKCGKLGNGILLRAACAMDTSALNVQEEEVYWQTFVDSTRHRLNGAQTTYCTFRVEGSRQIARRGR